jgi:hypothetical protein
VTLGLLWTSIVYAAVDELWVCRGGDGGEIYSNRQEGQGCKRYEPDAKLAVMSERGQGPSDYQKPVAAIYVTPPETERRRPPEKRRPGEIDFETFRMLSTGTTEAEILSRAGPPKHTFYIARGTWVWVYVNNGWLVEVTFSGGHVANISRYRPRP